MIYFDRVCTVVIENRNKIELTGCKIKFEINKSFQAKENTSKIEIYNLAPKTRQVITDEDSLIRIFAGYSSYKGLIEIGQGDISKVRHNRDKTEVVTEIFLAEGLNNFKNNPVSIAYAYNAPANLRQILDNIRAQSKLQFRMIDVDDSKTIDMGYSDGGSIDQVLDNLGMQLNFSWSCQNGVVIIKGNKSSGKGEVMLLTPESGLILHPESVKEVSKKLEKSEITKLAKRVSQVQALLQPSLQVHDLIKIQSAEINGLYEIQKIKHIGDTRGNDWYSTLEVIPQNDIVRN